MKKSLKAFLKESKIGLEGIDTRALTRHLRLSGSMKGMISTRSTDIHELLEMVRAYPGLVGRDLVREVSCRKPYLWEKGAPSPNPIPAQKTGKKPRVVVLDCGVKYNILRLLENNSCEVIVVPSFATGGEILDYQPEGAPTIT